MHCTLTPPLLHIWPPLHHVPSVQTCARNLTLRNHSYSGMRSAPSQYGTHYGAASAGQTPSSSNAPPPQLPAGAQVSRVGSRKSLASNRPQARARAPGGTDTSSTEAAPGATANAAPSSVSNLTHRVRTSLPGPGSGSGSGAGAGGSGASSPRSPDQQRQPHLGEEPERGRRMSGIKDVLDRPGRRPSMVSSNPASKPVSKDPYTRRESMGIPSSNGRSPSYTKTNGVSSFFLYPARGVSIH